MIERRKRNQNGVASRPIALRLPIGLLDKHKIICEENKLTNSALAFAAYQAGLPIVLKTLNQSCSSQTGLSDKSDSTDKVATFYSTSSI